MKSNKSKKLFYPDQFAPYMEVFNFLIDNNEIELTPQRKITNLNLDLFKYCVFPKSLDHNINRY